MKINYFMYHLAPMSRVNPLFFLVVALLAVAAFADDFFPYIHPGHGDFEGTSILSVLLDPLFTLHALANHIPPALIAHTRPTPPSTSLTVPQDST